MPLTAIVDSSEALDRTLTELQEYERREERCEVGVEDDGEGATEAGAVYFFDKALGSFFAEQLEFGRMQLATFQSGVAQAYPGAERFSDLDEADQDAYLKANEQTPFFQGARIFTLFGVFCLSKYGGNRNNIGWKLVGMDGPPHAWSYPFGYYDSEYMKEQENGE